MRENINMKNKKEKKGGILSQRRKDRFEGEEYGTPPRPGFTLAEILADKKSSDLFGKILERERGGKYLAEKIAKGKFDEGDIALLEEARQRYQEKVELSEGIENLLTEETMIEIAR